MSCVPKLAEATPVPAGATTVRAALLAGWVCTQFAGTTVRIWYVVPAVRSSKR